LEHALKFLEGRAVTSVCLDATAAGQRVYEKLGFEPQYALTRYEGRPAQARTPGQVTPATAGMLSKIIEFDLQVTGTHRAKMLARLFKEAPEAAHVVREGGELKGFVTCRPGANATQIGPCLAEPAAGRVLLQHAMGRYAGQAVFIDVPRDNAPAVETVEAAGLRVQRHFIRMVRGEPVSDNLSFLWASSGPEKG
jgi:hypothetical protein